MDKKKIEASKIIARAKSLEQCLDYEMAALYYSEAAKFLEEKSEWVRAAQLFEQEADCLYRLLKCGDLSPKGTFRAKEACLEAEELYKKYGTSKDINRIKGLKEYIGGVAKKTWAQQ